MTTDDYTGHFKQYKHKNCCDNDSLNDWDMSIVI